MTDMRRGAVTARFMLYLSSLTVGVTYLAIVGQVLHERSYGDALNNRRPQTDLPQQVLASRSG